MEAATITAIIGGIKSLGEMIQGVTDKSKKAQLESTKSILELSKAQLEAVIKDRDKLKEQVKELSQERDALAEKVGYFEVTNEYDLKDGLLYKKATGEGPYCPIDRIPMTVQGQSFGTKQWKCPKCGHDARAADADYAEVVAAMGKVNRPGGPRFFPG